MKGGVRVVHLGFTAPFLVRGRHIVACLALSSLVGWCFASKGMARASSLTAHGDVWCCYVVLSLAIGLGLTNIVSCVWPFNRVYLLGCSWRFLYVDRCVCYACTTSGSS